MTTKEYLEQVLKFDKKINKQLSELDYYRNLANGLSSISPSNVRVKSSGDKDVLSKRVVRIVELENKIDEMVDGYVEKRQTILDQIQELENETEKEVLYERFFNGITFEEISDKVGYTPRTIYNVYSSAMINFEQKFKKTYSKL